jgi:hypothetical protein
VRLSCTPRTALFREIATLEFCPPPTPGSSGRPGRASPTHSALANVAVAASPADSKVDRSLEAIEGRVGVRRLFSIFANRRYLLQTSTVSGSEGVPHPREQGYVEPLMTAPKSASRVSA